MHWKLSTVVEVKHYHSASKLNQAKLFSMQNNKKVSIDMLSL